MKLNHKFLSVVLALVMLVQMLAILSVGISAEGLGNEDAYADNNIGNEVADIEDPAVVTGTIIDNVNGWWNTYWEYNTETKVLSISSNHQNSWQTTESGSANYEGGWAEYIPEIEEVVLADRVYKISGNAFKDAVNLKKVTLLSSTTQIDSNAFKGCTNLTTISVAGKQTIEGVADLSNIENLNSWESVFDDTAIEGIILGNHYSSSKEIKASCLPDGLITIYGAGEYIESFCEANGYTFVPFGKCSDGVYWMIKGDVMVVEGTGAVNSLGEEVAQYAADVTELVIGEGVTSIADNAFAELTNLTKVTFNGNAPTVGTTVFGAPAALTVNYYDGATGFDQSIGGYETTKLLWVVGDTSGDLTVGIKDAVFLAQWLADWNVTIVERSADVTGDGEINIADAVRIAQYLAGWNVTLGS